MALGFDVVSLSATRDTIDMLYGPPVQVLSSCLRGFLTAAPGKRLIACDFSSIESRALAWLAGEKRKIHIFNTHGLVYEDVATGIFGVALEDVTKDQRQTGKTGELAFGFGGGKGAYIQMKKNFGIKLGDEEVEEAEAEKAKKGWRALHPETVAYWGNLQDASVQAVREAGRKVSVGPAHAKVHYLCKGSFLFCQLPSKRIITYPYPQLREQVWATFKYRNDKGKVKERGKFFNGKTFEICVRTAKLYAEKHGLVFVDANTAKSVVSYMAEDSTTRKFTRHYAYSGLLCENVTQATARDLLAHAMLKLDERGYHIVLHVHDEIVCEEELFWGSLEEVKAIMCELPEWAKGLPIAADGWEGKRYRK